METIQLKLTENQLDALYSQMLSQGNISERGMTAAILRENEYYGKMEVTKKDLRKMKTELKKALKSRNIYVSDLQAINRIVKKLEKLLSKKNPRHNGTKKGQVRKTARRAYEKNSSHQKPPKKDWQTYGPNESGIQLWESTPNSQYKFLWDLYLYPSNKWTISGGKTRKHYDNNARGYTLSSALKVVKKLDNEQQRRRNSSDWTKKPWGYLGKGQMKGYEIAENADARMCGGRYRLQTKAGAAGRWNVHGNGTLAEMKKLARQRKRGFVEPIIIEGIDTGFKKRRSYPKLSMIDLGFKKRRNSSDYILKLSPAQVEMLFMYHGGQTSMFYSVASQASRKNSGGQAKIRRKDMEYFQNELYSAMNIAENNGSSGDLRSLNAIDKKVEKLLGE